MEEIELKGEKVLGVKRERYLAIIAEHEIILIPKKPLSAQVKRYIDAVKVTTINPEFVDKTLPYREMKESIREYLSKIPSK